MGVAVIDRKDIVVYVAGPISKGPLHDNIKQACEAGMRLLKAGLSPHVPHLSCFMGCKTHEHLYWRRERITYNGRPWLIQHGESVQGYEAEVLPCGTTPDDWYKMDLAFVRRSDAILRLPGESIGAEAEVAEAKKHGIPVFHSVEEVLAWGA